MSIGLRKVFICLRRSSSGDSCGGRAEGVKGSKGCSRHHQRIVVGASAAVSTDAESDLGREELDHHIPNAHRPPKGLRQVTPAPPPPPNPKPSLGRLDHCSRPANAPALDQVHLHWTYYTCTKPITPALDLVHLHWPWCTNTGPGDLYWTKCSGPGTSAPALDHMHRPCTKCICTEPSASVQSGPSANTLDQVHMR